MQNYYKTIGAMAAASALAAGIAQAEVEYALHTGYSSEYIFRGQDLGSDLIEAGINASTEFAGLTVSAGAWFASYEDPAISLINENELDIYGEVSKDFGFLTASVGYIWYINSNSNLIVTDDAQEACFGISRDFGFLTAELTYYWDIETDNNGYTELALSRSFELNSCLNLNLSTAVGYGFESQFDNSGSEQSGAFEAWTTKASVDWAFTETATLSPYVAASVDLDGDAGLAVGDELFAGTILSVSF
ncbi:MAG: hypothetical protein EAZ42_09510 [Verrucomicrobia bacterium]|nr:MAG: hypothetical protein EAZ42_09510 [Verrucomicrobiota bacterium]